MNWKRVAKQGLKPSGYANLARALNDLESARTLTPSLRKLKKALARIVDDEIAPMKALGLIQIGRPPISTKETRAACLRKHAAIVRFMAERVEDGEKPADAKKAAMEKFKFLELRDAQRLWKKYGVLTLSFRENGRIVKKATAK